MIVNIEEEKLLVVSDLHLGSPASRAARLLPQFVESASAAGWSLCINGDAVDLLQYSMPKLFADVKLVQRSISELTASGGRCYFTLGNHDLVFEHLLADLPIDVSPLLNLSSGGRRIRIEHGHVYEPVFVRAPGIYEFGARLLRGAVLAHADVYRSFSRLQRLLHTRRKARADDGYPPYRAADALFQRGFDAVVFGHTHLAEIAPRPGGLFVNSGEWMHGCTYVSIDHGRIGLHRWPADPLPQVESDHAV